MPYSASSRTSTGGTTGVKPWPASTDIAPPDERELEQHEVAHQVGEARAGHARAGLDVDQRSGDVEVVAAGGALLAHLAQRPCRLSAAVGSGGFGSVAERGLQLGVGVRQLLPERLHALGDLLHRGDLLGRVAARLLGGADRLRRLVLARAQVLHLGPQRARALVELEHAVQPLVGPVAAARQRRPHRVRDRGGSA